MRFKQIVKDYKKYAAKGFSSKRLKKKQITKLVKEYERLCKVYHILGTSLTLRKEIHPKEDIVTRIDCIYNFIEIQKKSDRGEVWTIGADGKKYLPKDQPGFVPKI